MSLFDFIIIKKFLALTAKCTTAGLYYITPIRQSYCHSHILLYEENTDTTHTPVSPVA
jgi:hypothetical protein